MIAYSRHCAHFYTVRPRRTYRMRHTHLLNESKTTYNFFTKKIRQFIITSSSQNPTRNKGGMKTFILNRLLIDRAIFLPSSSSSRSRSSLIPNVIRPLHRRAPSLRHIHADPNDNTRGCAQCEQKWESFPVVACIVDDGLNDVRSDHRGCTVG
jgi:hypothetical protein